MVVNSNQKLLEALASLLADGKIDPEAYNKLLNTTAKFEERIAQVENNSNPPTQVE